MDAPEAVEGVRLKIARADKHLTEFGVIVGGYFARRPLRLDGFYDEAASQWVVVVRIDEPLPADVATIVGDAAHNLRSALDQLAWALARLGATAPKDTKFPIFKHAADFTRNAHRGLRGVAKEHVEFIERLQPYHERELYGHPLFILNRLSNVDKHKHVHLAQTSLAGASLRIEGLGGGVAIGGIHLAFGALEDGAEVARIDVYGGDDGEPALVVGIDGAFDLAVDDEGNELSVAGGLFYARDFVGDVVDWFAPAVV